MYQLMYRLATIQVCLVNSRCIHTLIDFHKPPTYPEIPENRETLQMLERGKEKLQRSSKKIDIQREKYQEKFVNL